MTIIIPILMIITGFETNLSIVPIFILAFIMLYYIKGNAYKIYKIKGISNEEEKKIEEEKKWVKNKNKLAVITSAKLILTGVILFIVRKFAWKHIRSFKQCI